MVLVPGRMLPYLPSSLQTNALQDTQWFSGLDFSNDIYAILLNIIQDDRHAMWCINDENLGMYLVLILAPRKYSYSDTFLPSLK